MVSKPENSTKDAPQWLYVTASSNEEAKSLARDLVTARLVACANILGNVQSVYWWDESVQEDTEVALIFKTRKSLVDQATQRIVKLHSYDCPCVVALDISGGHAPYLNWILKETS